MNQIYEQLDFLLAAKGISIEIDDEIGEWCWVEQVTPDSRLWVHGSPAYSRDDAYEDALRGLIGLSSIADSIQS